MTGRKISAVVFGILGLAVGAALISGGISMLVQDRDEDDFFKTEAYTFSQPSYAIVSEDIEILTEAPSWLIDWVTDPVDLRIEGSSTAGGALFVGVAPTAQVDAYLAGVAHHQVTGIDFDGSTIGGVDYRSSDGFTEPPAPTTQAFWTEAVFGDGTQTLDWSLESGNWTAVVMNADGTPGVSAGLALGARVSNIVALSWIGIALGALSVLLGGYLAYRGLRRRDEGVGGARPETIREKEMVGQR
jgi:hypothetical protein